MPEAVGPAAVPPPEGFVRVRMNVAYDGTPFHGFARNPDVVTVQSELENTLAQVLRHPVTVTGAGRTDAGVHARGQVVSFDADESHFEPGALSRALNRMLGPTIAVGRIETAPPSFDARFSCTGRSYRYHVFNRAVIDPLTRYFTWHVRDRLDIDTMQRASEAIIGTHDFTSFSKRNKSKRSGADPVTVFPATLSPLKSRPVLSLIRWCEAWWACVLRSGEVGVASQIWAWCCEP